MTKVRISTSTPQGILITREFAASRQQLFQAWTTPDLIKRWWSGGWGEQTVAEVDLRPGGQWRYVLRTEDGSEVGFHGEYLEVVPAEKLVWTEVYEGAPAEESTVIAATFSGDTTLNLLITAQDEQTRDAILASGMEVGLEAGYDLLEDLAR